MNDLSQPLASLPPELNAPSIQLLTGMWLLWHTFAQRGEKVLHERHSLDLRSFIAMSYLQNCPQRPAQLSSILGVPRYEVSRTIKELEAQQLVTRTPQGDDGRSVSIALTEMGHQTWREALLTVQEVIDPVLAGLDPSQVQQVTRSLFALYTKGETL